MTALSDHPSCWSIDGARGIESEDVENEESSDDESDVQEGPVGSSLPRANYSLSLAYREFLKFLESGCAGSPLQGYPAVLVILSTIPKSVRSEIAIITMCSNHLPRYF